MESAEFIRSLVVFTLAGTAVYLAGVRESLRRYPWWVIVPAYVALALLARLLLDFVWPTSHGATIT